MKKSKSYGPLATFVAVSLIAILAYLFFGFDDESASQDLSETKTEETTDSKSQRIVPARLRSNANPGLGGVENENAPPQEGSPTSAQPEEKTEFVKEIGVALRGTPENFVEPLFGILVNEQGRVVFDRVLKWDWLLYGLPASFMGIADIREGIDEAILNQGPLFVHGHTLGAFLRAPLRVRGRRNIQVVFQWKQRQEAVTWNIHVVRGGEGPIRQGQLSAIILGSRESKDLVNSAEYLYLNQAIGKNGIVRIRRVPPKTMMAFRYHRHKKDVRNDWLDSTKTPEVLLSPAVGKSRSDTIIVEK